MLKHTFILPAFFFGLVGCNSDSPTITIADETAKAIASTEATVDTHKNIRNGNFYSTFFSNDLTSETLVSCTLENGSTTTCYQLTFTANGAGDTEGDGTIGPYCPETIDTPKDAAGVGIYDGETNPGLQPLVDAALAMDADGFDIVDEDGNINAVGGGPGQGSACLEMPLDNTLEITYLIPVTPELRSEPYYIGTVESIGFGVTGVPFKGDPPGVAVVTDGVRGSGSGNIPSLDICGGHADPAGYYHWHFIPQSMNTLLASDAYNLTEQYGLSCSNSNVAYDDPSAFAGLAKDGFPIYGAYDSIDDEDTSPSLVSTVDECNGHSHSTEEFPDGVYHYHALEDVAPNVPVCLMGSFVERRDFSIH